MRRWRVRRLKSRIRWRRKRGEWVGRRVGRRKRGRVDERRMGRRKRVGGEEGAEEEEGESG